MLRAEVEHGLRFRDAVDQGASNGVPVAGDIHIVDGRQRLERAHHDERTIASLRLLASPGNARQFLDESGTESTHPFATLESANGVLYGNDFARIVVGDRIGITACQII